MSALQENISKAEAYLKRFRDDGVMNHIDGKVMPAADGETFEVISPIDLNIIANCAHGKSADIDQGAKSRQAVVPKVGSPFRQRM